MNGPGPVLLAAVTALSLAAMAAMAVPTLVRREGLYLIYFVYQFWWVPALGLGSLCLLIWRAFAGDPFADDPDYRPPWRWWLLAPVPVFLLPLIFLIYFKMICSGQDCP